MDIIIAIFNSNFFIAIVTLSVGGFAIGLYKKQKNDYKRDVALLILQEIRYAEQQVRSSQDFSPNAENYPLSSKLLPTNSWYKNIHLFMGDFKQPQIDAISRFYAQVEYIDLIIEKISDYKTSLIEQSVSDLSGRVIQSEDILPDRIHLYGIVNLLAASQRNLPREESGQGSNIPQTSSGTSSPQPQLPSMINILRRLKANSILKEVSSKVEFIYNTPVGEKFREISESKWLWFF